jgi:dephospho-CoA kinase
MLLVGKAGAGKDTFAAMFPKLRRFAFGDEVRKIVSLAQIDGSGVALDYIVGRLGMMDSRMILLLKYAEKSNATRKKRTVLQVVGQGFRDIDPDFWIKLLKADIHDAGEPPYIITDCRYRNEFEAFPNDVSVYVYASRKTRIKRLTRRDGFVTYKQLNHPSEKEINTFCDLCTYKVNNTWLSLRELRQKAEAIAKREA